MSTKHPNCPSCTCGKITVEWSDRSAVVDPTDVEELASSVFYCSFDHSYDRTASGVPYNFPSNYHRIAECFVSRWMKKRHPEFARDKTVDADEGEKAAFIAQLVAVFKGAENNETALP